MAYITGLATNICKPISTNSHSVSTDDSIRSTLSAPCSASQVTSPHRLTQNSTQETGNTPHVVAVGDNRIGMLRTSNPDSADAAHRLDQPRGWRLVQRRAAARHDCSERYSRSDMR